MHERRLSGKVLEINFPAVSNLVMDALDFESPVDANCVRVSSHGVLAGVRYSCTSITFYNNLACVSIKRMITVCIYIYIYICQKLRNVKSR